MKKGLFTAIHDQSTPPIYKNLLNGNWVNSPSYQLIDCISPLDQSVIGRIPTCGEAEIDHAFATAQQAQIDWATLPRTKRAEILLRGAALMRQHSEELIAQLIREIGKSHGEAKDEIHRSAYMIESFAHATLSVQGTLLSGDAFLGYKQSKMALIDSVPLGVILAIPPFNYPVNLAVAKIAPALLMGNAVIVKPPTQGALSCLSLVACLQEAGLPPGILATVTGEGKTVGNMLVNHPAVNMIAFTGSSPVGKAIAKQVGMIPLLFECGGNNAALVLSDADLNLAAKEITRGVFAYSGQRCTAIKYVLGPADILRKLLRKIKIETAATIHVGDPRQEHITFGPLISEKAAQEVESAIKQAKKSGAKVIMGGKRRGLMVEPTILTNVQPDAAIVKTEVFGPIVSFIAVESVEEMVRIVNASSYGLQASIFTHDEGTGVTIAKQLHVGSIQINSKPQRGPDHFPFLGIKDSGVGVQGIAYTLQMMSRTRSVVIGKP